MMKITTDDGADLRCILAGMIMDRTVCARIASKWEAAGLFGSPNANLIGRWCVEHVRKYGHPPGDQLRDLFDAWALTANEETARTVEGMLRHVSEKSLRDLSSDYVLDVAGKHFDKVRLRKMCEEVEVDVERNCVDEAFQEVAKLSRLELGVGSVVKPAEDYEVWRAAFDRSKQISLLRYPGRLDAWLGSRLTRDRLIAFMGPDKSFKSFWLLDLAYRAVRAKHRVAFFDVGDMVEADVIQRLGARVARIPFELPLKIEVPETIDYTGKVRSRTVVYDALLSSAQGYEAFKRFCRGKDLFRLSCHPNSSISVDGIESLLRDWEKEDWVPDVVVIDYADILAPPAGVRDTLDQIDDTWKNLRRMSQQWHCLVVTATQSSALAYGGKQKVLGRRHFSGRKTKLAHVNGMVGLNVSPADRDRGVTRINWVVQRHGRYSEWSALPVAGCLAIANPAIKSAEKDVPDTV